MNIAGVCTASFVFCTAMVLAAAPAHAGVTALTIAPNSPVYDVDCPYQLTAELTNGEGPVLFTDNGQPIPGSPVSPVYADQKAYIEWTPTTLGFHELRAIQTNPTRQAAITVFVIPCPLSSCMVR